MRQVVFYSWIDRYLCDERAVAAVESALMFPTLIMMLVSMVDIGNGLLSNQKLIAAAQITVDLVTRESNPTLTQRSEAITAGQIAMSPYPIDEYEYMITSIRFDASGDPEVVWQESSGLVLDPDLLNGTSDLGKAGEGVVMVVVSYTYHPFFTGFIIGDIRMEEVAYARGRKSAVVGEPLEGNDNG